MKNIEEDEGDSQIIDSSRSSLSGVGDLPIPPSTEYECSTWNSSDEEN